MIERVTDHDPIVGCVEDGSPTAHFGLGSTVGFFAGSFGTVCFVGAWYLFGEVFKLS
jgi:hypothetical protein